MEAAAALGLSPAGCLTLLWPALSPTVAPPPARAKLEHLALSLPPIARLALEFRLTEGADGVDLHQLITRQDGDAEMLARHLQQPGTDAVLGQSLGSFARDWANGAAGLGEEIDRVFLEWDEPADDASLAAPAIFVPLDLAHHGRIARQRRRDLLRGLIARLEGGRNRPSPQALDSILAAARGHVSVSHLGAMLGRKAGLRINFRGVRRGQLAALLRELRWPGDVAAAEAQFAVLVDLADRVTVAFDVAHRVCGSIGFETVLDAAPDREPRWRALFDHLGAQQLCAPAKRDCLLKVNATLRPEHPEQEWPAAWLVAASMRSRSTPWFERRLSHVKVSIAADGSASAKAYVTAQHAWTDARGPAVPGICRRRRRINLTQLIWNARSPAAIFLLRACHQSGLWSDFQLANGPSDEWVSAFVGGALASQGSRALGAVGAVQRTLTALLSRQRPGGGFGYNRFSPADADSTAWVLKFFAAVDHRGPETANARRFLGSHLLAGGGLGTYAADTPIVFRPVTGARGTSERGSDDRGSGERGSAELGSGERGSADRGSDGWRGSHSCVVANAAGVLGRTLLPSLRDTQRPDGSWSAYWWKTDAMATCMAAQALSALPSAQRRVSRAIAWARAQAMDRASVFDQAWFAQLLNLGGTADRFAAIRLLAGMARQQLTDGSWTSGAQMLFPSPCDTRRPPDTTPILDDRRVFTTAAALRAIDAISLS